MDPARWRQIEAVFHQARPLPSDEQKALLDALRKDDADLVEQVEAMLSAGHQASSHLQGILQTAVVEALERLPDNIGPYEVVSRIGSGGFSSVYLAHLPNEPGERVAIKVLRRGLATPRSEQRLVQESQILARLHHPNIARLLGHGTTSDGEPYFVMEVVDGEPIDRFCDAHRWSLEQRLQLFRTVCAAVDYAHRNLVIHRDIKPSNVLVTKDGTAKLLDFGIAKLLLPDLLRSDPVDTVPGGSLMTPDFASPEQIREEPLNTATDVYSLGVLLYRLLCGRPPYRFARRTPRTIEETVATVEPPAPSAAIHTRLAAKLAAARAEEPTGDDIASRRRTTAAQLRRQLRGDLDSIVLTALRKQPEQRYPSAAQLSQDIARYLRSAPITARRVSVLYRARKFVARHRLAVAVAATILLTLMSAVVVTTRATLRAEAERQRAERHLAESRQVTDFLVDIFEVPDPARTQGREVTAKQLLDEGARRIATQLQHQPEVRATLMTTMAKVYRNLGDHETSRRLLEKALAQHRQQLPEADPRVIAGQQELARALLVQGEYDAARMLLQQTRSVQRSAGSSATAGYAQTLALLAEAESQLDRPAAAAALFRQTITLQRRLLAADDPALIDSVASLAELLAADGDLDAAEMAFREALALRRSRLGDLHPDVARNLSNLAFVLHGKRQLEAAEEAIREAVAIRAELYGDEHWIVDKSYNNLAQILTAQGRGDEAIVWMEKALAIGRTQLGADHPQVAERLVNLALTYQKAGRPRDAEATYLAALGIHEQKLGEHHPSTARNLYNLAGLYAETRRQDEALALLDRVIDIFRTAVPEDDYRLSYPLYLRGRIHADRGDCAPALTALGEALRIRQKRHTDDHAEVAQVKAEIDRCKERGQATPS